MFLIFKPILFLMLLLFMLTGCTSGGRDEQAVRNVRILFGRVDTFNDIILFEYVAPDDFKVVSFRIDWLLCYFCEEHDDNYCQPALFKIANLNDFTSKSPLIERVISADSRIIIQEEKMNLSAYQLTDVLQLVENIARRRTDREFEFAPVLGHTPYVWAIINGNMYWTYYTGDVRNLSREIRRYVNNDLLALAYKLIELSPIPVFGR